MKSRIANGCMFLGCLFLCLTPCRADFATPFVEIHNKPGDVSVSHAFVAALGPEMGSRFLVIVMDDQFQPVVLWATAKQGVLTDSLLGREISIEAVIKGRVCKHQAGDRDLAGGTAEGQSRTRRRSEREPANSLRNKSNVIGGRLRSLTYSLGVTVCARV